MLKPVLAWTGGDHYRGEVIDTELLHLCQIVFWSLTFSQQQYEYKLTLNELWQQHVIELARVKGIKIV